MHDEEINIIPKVPQESNNSWRAIGHEHLSRQLYYLEEDLDGIDLYLLRIHPWWKQANILGELYVSQMEKYRHTLSYIPCPGSGMDMMKYAAACFADWNLSFFERAATSPNTTTTKSLSVDMFYRAVITHAVDSKLLQILETFLGYFPDFQTGHRVTAAFETIQLVYDSVTDLRPQSIESLKVFDYVYNFMLFRIFNQPGGYLFNDDIMSKNLRTSVLENWIVFFEAIQSLLTPFDILRLFQTGSEYASQSSLPDFLSDLLSIVYSWDGNYEEHGPEPKNPYDEVWRKLGQPEDKAWEAFRYQYWRSNIRGQIFAVDFDAESGLRGWEIHLERNLKPWRECICRCEPGAPRRYSTSLLINMDPSWLRPLGDFSTDYELQRDCSYPETAYALNCSCSAHIA